MKQLLAQISRIGIRVGDDDHVILKKQFLVYQGLAMSGGGLVWGALLLIFGYPMPSVIPFGYVVITAINFYCFGQFKNFQAARHVQTTISLLLPFMMQWLLGGFQVSGGVMLWSILALLSSVPYQNMRESGVWFAMFVVLTLLSLLFDPYFVQNFNMGVTPFVSLIFLVVNILGVSGIVFGLVLYFTSMNDTNMDKVTQSYVKLINSEKLAALGQVSAGVAHEVNTPLGAIKSSAEESSMALDELLVKLPEVIRLLDAEERDLFFAFISSLQFNYESLSTREEREIKRTLRTKLEDLNIDNARFLADRLVQVGIYDMNPTLEMLSRHTHFEDLVMLTYNLLNQKKNNETIKLAVDKASRVVRALKNYLHTTGSEAMEPVNLQENIDTVLTIYHNRLKQGIAVNKNFEPAPEVLGFPDQLNQVWTNLIVNAIQAMDYRGTLTLGIHQNTHNVVVTIQDTGKGIPEEIQQRIFDPFFTTKVSGEGSGLGLDIIKRILNDHHGHISFESKVGVGTTFTVKLPINQTS